MLKRSFYAAAALVNWVKRIRERLAAGAQDGMSGGSTPTKEGAAAPGRQDRAILSTRQGIITSDRIFDARFIVGDDKGRRVVLAIGPLSVLLQWPDVAQGEQIEVLLDGMFCKGHPFRVDPPFQITMEEIVNWGPNSPPNIRWLFNSGPGPDVDQKRVVAMVTKDFDYRFLFEDEATARRVDETITETMRTAGYTVT